ncbi:MAG: hypothetical protein M3450_02050, partial [Actinomycetota bacterium]|nr:hypothetical protein [Actinomycetota bacterium]
MADVDAAPPGPNPAVGDADRLEALEQQVRQLTSRLAGWVEAQLVQALDDRRNDMKTLRSEMQVLLDEQRAAKAAKAAGGGSSPADVERLEALEQRVRAAMSRLSDSVEARLAEV